MSDSKRTGGRDISELKQRLGLKKGAAGGAATTGTAATGTGQTPAARTNGTTGGVVPPPGLNLPPPPGLAPPPSAAPAGPVVPNASDDPFGAMNAMAAVGTVQRAPEFVIINDGRPVEDVSGGKRGGAIAKLALPAVAALLVGLGIGRISQSADSYNDGLKGAKAINSNVHDTKKTLADLESALEEAASKNFAPDTTIDKKLEQLDTKLDVKSELVFRAKENSLDPAVAGQIMSFYAGVDEVKAMLDGHTKAAKSDDMAIKAGEAKATAATATDADNAVVAASASHYRYAMLMSAPTEQDKTDFGAKFVEIGPPYCGDKLSTTGRCGDNEQPSGYAYRTDPGSVWTKGDLQLQGADSVPAKKLVLLVSTPVLDSVVKGTDAGASEALYQKRLKALAERTKKLIEDANKLEAALQTESSKGDHFNFFI